MKILLVEDNVSLCRNIASVLQNEGYTVVTCSNGNEAEFQMLNNSSDLILLDRMLPGIDGITLTREARTAGITVPILLLTALDTLGDKVTGLDAGADDYIVKPFDSNELVARVGALLRRSAMTESAQKQPQSAAYDVTSADHVGTFVEYDGLVVNISNYTVTFEGHNLEMPPKELEILYFLASRPNQVFTREQLLDKLWGYEYVGDTRTVDVHIKRLREKLNNNHNWSIATVWGIGYKFEWRS